MDVFEQKLLRRKNEILPMLKHFEEESENVTRSSDLDWHDQAQNPSEAHLVGRLASCFQRELQGIEIALGRIRMGSFGICRACHQHIEPSRLERFTQAEFCSRCNNSN
jgi:RNA polymerase-binding transcription factor DksA